MNAGRDDDALWSAYLDGTLEPQARARAEARLRASAADRETLEAMRLAEARLRTTAVPDPGVAYWRDFGARVESRLQPAAELQADPARIYEKLVGWLVLGGRVRWMRAAGALAGLTLVTYIGMRGFRPSEVRMHPVDVPKQDQVVHDAPEATDEFRSHEPGAISPPAKTTQRAESDDAAVKFEAEASQPRGTRAIEPQPEAVAKPDAPSPPREQVEEKLHGAGRVDATAPRSAPAPQRDLDRLGTSKVPKPVDSGAELHVRDGRSNEATIPIPPSTADKEKLAFREDAKNAQRSAADSLASYLEWALRDDAPRARDEAVGRGTSPRVNQLNKTAPGVVGKPTASAPAPPPLPPLPAIAEVDRLLRLADLAQRYETDATFRPHLETIAMRLADYARQDPRAAARARALMRTLAANSATTRERATWEERLHQLPP